MKNRTQVVFYLNNILQQVEGDQIFLNLSDYLRYVKNKTGTKVVCAEGDCGACTVLKATVHDLQKNRLMFKTVNSCILPVFNLDGCHVVTVEGLRPSNEPKGSLHPTQASLVKNLGTQCGFCTPGIVCSMVGLFEEARLQKKTITEKKIKNYLTGNLCRCTGYNSIVKAAIDIENQDFKLLQEIYHDPQKNKILMNAVKTPLHVQFNNQSLYLPLRIKQAVDYKKKYPEAKIIAGATDILVAVNKGQLQLEKLISLQNIESAWAIKIVKNNLVIGSQVTLTAFQNYIHLSNPEMYDLLKVFASPQIKNNATLVGNVINASPIADTIPFLMVSDAQIAVQNHLKKRIIPIEKFYMGYKKLNLKSNEIVTSIHIPLMNRKEKHFVKLIKVSLRKDLDISAVTLAVRLSLSDEKKIIEARVAIGGVGPTVLRLPIIEKMWVNKKIQPEIFQQAAKKIRSLIKPYSDLRGSAEYRYLISENLFNKIAAELSEMDSYKSDAIDTLQENL